MRPGLVFATLRAVSLDHSHQAGAAVNRAGASEGDVVEFVAGDQRIRDAVNGVGLGLGLEGRRIREAEFREGLGGLDDGAGVEMQVEHGAEHKRRSAEDALRHDEFSAARFLHGGNGLRTLRC